MHMKFSNCEQDMISTHFISTKILPKRQVALTVFVAFNWFP